MDSGSVDRRRFVGLLTLGTVTLVEAARAQEPAAGRLYNPNAVQRRAPTVAADNEAFIMELEKTLKCQCGCNLDVYTCRTTDFTCTTSPALHREVVAHWENGLTAEQIQDEFVREYGEQALMAPKPEGFNLAGYLVPGAVMLAGIGALSLWILRRQRQVEAAAIGAVPVDAGRPGAAATSSELERLQRALSEIDD